MKSTVKASGSAPGGRTRAASSMGPTSGSTHGWPKGSRPRRTCTRSSAPSLRAQPPAGTSAVSRRGSSPFSTVRLYTDPAEVEASLDVRHRPAIDFRVGVDEVVHALALLRRLERQVAPRRELDPVAGQRPEVEIVALRLPGLA